MRLVTAWWQRYALYIAAAAFAAISIAAGVQTVRLGVERTSHEQTKRAFADERTAAARAHIRELDNAIEEGNRRVAKQAAVANYEARRAAAAQADAAAAAAAAGGLRNRADLFAAAASSCTADSAAASKRAADRLAHAVASLAEAGGQLAARADRAIIRGAECAGRYDALTEKTGQ